MHTFSFAQPLEEKNAVQFFSMPNYVQQQKALDFQLPLSYGIYIEVLKMNIIYLEECDA